MDATSNKFPWVVQIADWRKSLKTLCSGTLINGHYVLTTGSCVASFKNVPLNLIVITGTKKRLANEIILHDRYNPASFENNIALLKFLMPFNVIPACLPSEEISFAGNQSGAVFGWTQKKDLETHGTKSIANRWGELVRSPVLVTKCGDNQVHSTVLCASERDYSDESKICKQTTGGGPLILAKHPRSRFKLIGVSNIGVECGDAAEKIITFADIQKHLAWMKRITKTTCITCLK
ncbi:complement factor I-like [Neocloeon triangulifer]|uniref:complement factor I-like n=1 Tax=Neocloeon triangulifer TaxID=2078957 RepID=UPI00286EC75B|nr:complement factor I-like [Neocloeon triangulifer]